jgi:hypothetical protein
MKNNVYNNSISVKVFLDGGFLYCFKSNNIFFSRKKINLTTQKKSIINDSSKVINLRKKYVSEPVVINKFYFRY